MTIHELSTLMQSGNFHHATYRNQGTLWEELWIYAKDPNAPRGFRSVGCFNRSGGAQENEAAYEMVRTTGVSVGAFGRG